MLDLHIEGRLYRHVYGWTSMFMRKYPIFHAHEGQTKNDKYGLLLKKVKHLEPAVIVVKIVLPPSGKIQYVGTFCF